MKYEIYEGLQLELNHVTPFSIKKYQERLKSEGSKSTENIMEVVNNELPKQLKDDAITPTGIKNIIEKAIHENVVASLDIYVDRKFVDEWIDVVFKITPEQIEKTKEDFDKKFYMNEFMRGYSDFFGQLRGRSN